MLPFLAGAAVTYLLTGALITRDLYRHLGFPSARELVCGVLFWPVAFVS